MSHPQLIDQRRLNAGRDSLGQWVIARAAETEARLGFGYRPSDLAPVSWPALLREHHSCSITHAPLRVSSHDTDDIYRTDVETFVWRYWHNASHVRLGVGFTAYDEFEVADYHLGRLRCAGFGPRSLEHRLLHADTMGQTLLHAMSGRHPRSRCAFAVRVIEVGLDQAIAEEVRALGEAGAA